jgi:hypothetical protein
MDFHVDSKNMSLPFQRNVGYAWEVSRSPYKNKKALHKIAELFVPRTVTRPILMYNYIQLFMCIFWFTSNNRVTGRLFFLQIIVRDTVKK